MKEKPIIEKMEKHLEKYPDTYEWTPENTPKEMIDFHENIRTSSDNFWYALNNGYIATELITDEYNGDDIYRIEEIVDKFGIEF